MVRRSALQPMGQNMCVHPDVMALSVFHSGHTARLQHHSSNEVSVQNIILKTFNTPSDCQFIYLTVILCDDLSRSI